MNNDNLSVLENTLELRNRLKRELKQFCDKNIDFESLILRNDFFNINPIQSLGCTK